MPEKITIDKSGADTVAITSIHADSGPCIEMRKSKYLNNIVEQDNRAGKRIARPMLGTQDLWPGTNFAPLHRSHAHDS